MYLHGKPARSPGWGRRGRLGGHDVDETIGFIGLGLMGQPLASRLLGAGFDVWVWNRTPGKCDDLIEQGAELADSIAELTERVDIVMLCVSDTAAVREIVFGEDGVASAGREDQLLVDLSSIEPEATREFARELDSICGMPWVDAPVSGGVPGAENGTLVVMAGGEDRDVERARPVLGAFSQRVTRMGGTGAGQVTKVCNQMIVGCNALVITEMIAMAERAGVDAERIPAALRGGFADSIPLQVFGPRMAVRLYEPVLGKLGTLMKDLDTAVALARRNGSAIPMTGLAAQLVRQYGMRGGLDEDWATIIERYSE